MKKRALIRAVILFAVIISFIEVRAQVIRGGGGPGRSSAAARRQRDAEFYRDHFAWASPQDRLRMLSRARALPVWRPSLAPSVVTPAPNGSGSARISRVLPGSSSSSAGGALTPLVRLAPSLNTNAWTMIGPMPSNFFGTNWSGRTLTIAVDPANDNNLYVGTSYGGGLWATNNGGATWVPLGDDPTVIVNGALGGLQTLNNVATIMQMNSVAIDPVASSPSKHVVYVGTGYGVGGLGLMRVEVNPQTMQVLTASLRGSAFVGGAVERIVIDPTPETTGTRSRAIYACSAQRGLRVSRDECQTFTTIANGQIQDFALDPTDTTKGYFGFVRQSAPAAPAPPAEGVYEVDNLPTPTSGTYVTLGSPTSANGFTTNGYRTDQPAFSRASITAARAGGALTIFTSFFEGGPLPTGPVNDSVVWQYVSNRTPQWKSFGPNGFAGTPPNMQLNNNTVRVDPADPTIVYLGGTFPMLRKSVGGAAFVSTTNNLIVDNTDIVIDPRNRNRVFFTCDRGVYVMEQSSPTASITSATLFSLNERLPDLLIHQVSTHPTDPNIVIASLHDNSVNKTRVNTLQWDALNGGGEGGCAIDQTTPTQYFANTPGAVVWRSQDAGASWPNAPIGTASIDPQRFITPFRMDESTTGANATLYFGTNHLWQSRNAGNSWSVISNPSDLGTIGGGPIRNTISTIAVAPPTATRLLNGTTVNPSDFVYAGIDAPSGRIAMTSQAVANASAAWRRVGAATFVGGFPGHILVDPFFADRLYVVYNRDIFRVDNAGGAGAETITNIGTTKGFPGLGNVLAAVPPASSGQVQLFAGTDIGVFELDQAPTATWKRMDNFATSGVSPTNTGTAALGPRTVQSLPTTIITDLKYNPNTQILYAATFGRSCWAITVPNNGSAIPTLPPAYIVTNTNATGPGSLAEAVNFANAPTGAKPPDSVSISFQLTPGSPNAQDSNGAFVIQLVGPLPNITRNGVVIDGTTESNFRGMNPNRAGGPPIVVKFRGPGLKITGTAGNSLVKGLVLQNATTAGVTFSGNGASGGQVQQCFVGTDSAGRQAVANAEGIRIENGAQNCTIGGIGPAIGSVFSALTPSTASAGNVISGNTGDGIVVSDATTQGVRVSGNYIGVGADGTAVVGNGNNGVLIVNGAKNNIIGADRSSPTVSASANVIASNRSEGVRLDDGTGGNGSATGNTVRGNAIFSNGGLGLNLVGGAEDLNGVTANGAAVNGPNRLQHYPVLNSSIVANGVLTVTGSLDSTAAQSAYPITIDFYSNPGPDPSGFGEGRTFLGSVSPALSGPGNFTFSRNGATLGPGQYITAVATDAAGNSSEFSRISPINAGVPSQLTFTVQPSTTGAGLPITPAVQVSVLDFYNSSVATATNSVTIGVGTNPNGGTLSGTRTVNTANGVATFSNLSLDRVGSGYTLAATSPGLTNATSIAFDILPGPPARLSFSVQPTNSVIGGVITPAVKIAVQDRFGNSVPNATNSITVALGNNPANAALGGTKTVNAASGIAVFADLTVDKVGSGYTIAATTAGLTGAGSGTFDVAAFGPPAKLTFTAQPSNTAAGTAITPALKVTVQDAPGNTVANATTPITIALGTNPSNGTLSGTKTLNAVNGVATFSDLNIDRPGTGYTLTASATGLTSAASSAFNIVVGAPIKLGFRVQPTDTLAGSVITPPLQVAIQDAGGNTVTSASANVVIALANNPSGGALFGTATVATVGGVATFNDLKIDKAGPGYTLAASATGLANGTSAPFNVVVGIPMKLAFLVQPANSVTGDLLTPTVKVEVEDINGNRVTAATTPITIALGNNPRGGTLAGTLAVNANAGVATFPNLIINRKGTGYTLAASASGLTGATSASFDVAYSATVTIGAGLTMVTMPLIPEDNDPLRIVGFTNNRWARFAPSANSYARYPAAGSLFDGSAGKGYWVFLDNARTVTIDGAVVRQQPLVIPLEIGWNQIGNAFSSDVRWSIDAIKIRRNGEEQSLRAAEVAGLVEPFLWAWRPEQNAYRPVYDSSVVPGVQGVIESGRGYWMKSNVAAEVIIPPPSRANLSATLPRRSPAPGGEWKFNVSAECGGTKDNVIVGASSGGGQPRMQIARPPAAPTGQDDLELYLVAPQRSERLGIDVRPSQSANEAWQLVVHAARANTDVALTWDNLGSAPRALRFYLVDQTTGARRAMRSSSSYVFRAGAAGEERRFRLEVDSSPNEQRLVSDLTVLNSSALAGARLSVTLTKPATVSARILSPSGKIAAVLVTGLRARQGANSLAWNGKSATGAALPRGVYLVEISAVADDGEEARATRSVTLR